MAILILSVLFGVKEPVKFIQVSDSQRVGTTQRFTIDAKGKPVLSWAEKDGDKGNYEGMKDNSVIIVQRLSDFKL